MSDAPSEISAYCIGSGKDCVYKTKVFPDGCFESWTTSYEG